MDLTAVLGIELLTRCKQVSKQIGGLLERFDTIEAPLLTITGNNPPALYKIQAVVADPVAHENVYQEKVKEAKDDQFLNWLSPSHWLVESQLQIVQSERHKGTLQWALDMPRFKSWQVADSGSNERILWICGGPGIGKSTMAGYYIDYLKRHYCTSIVAYFFYKGGRLGLTSAYDIIRTLAYQISLKSERVRLALEELKKSLFPIDENLGVRYLFTKLLQEPFSQGQDDAYIIIDGLDQAANSTNDLEQTKLDLEILFECFPLLQSARVLLFSRPVGFLNDLIPGSNIKQLECNENAGDIRIYVTNEIERLEKVQRWLPPEIGDYPVEYFVQKSRGLFLWVSLSLRQLAKARSKKSFHNCFHEISQSGGNLDMLYTAILSTLTYDERKWVAEIMRWLVGVDSTLTIDELQGAVQWSLEDEIDDFKSFLTVECGSIFQLIRGRKGRTSVQLIHETFQTFLLLNVVHRTFILIVQLRKTIFC